MKIIIILSLMLSLNVFANPVLTDITECVSCKEKARSCFVCHGESGYSLSSVWPNLAGQKSDYLVKQLRDFKSGKRKDGMMNAIASGLSEKDMKDIANYFSKRKCK